MADPMRDFAVQRYTFLCKHARKSAKKIRLLMVSVCDRICMDVGKCRYQLGIGSVFPALRPVQIPSRYRADTEQIPSRMADEYMRIRGGRWEGDGGMGWWMS